MTPRDFCLWLSGFVDYHLDNAVIPTAATMDKITAKLDSVVLNENAPRNQGDPVALKSKDVEDAYDLIAGMFPEDEEKTDPNGSNQLPDTDPWLHLPLTDDDIELIRNADLEVSDRF